MTTNTAPRLCAYHASHGVEAAHPDAGQWGTGMVVAKLSDDAEDAFLEWEAVYEKFMDCDVCVHEQLLFLSGYVAALRRQRPDAEEARR